MRAATAVLGRLVRGVGAATMLATLVAGLPWALLHTAGWPLPDHLPRLDEIGTLLIAPISQTTVLGVLACLAWLLWLLFVIDVVSCTVETARGVRWPRPHTGPVRRVAAVLVGALLAAVLGRVAIAAPLEHTPATASVTATAAARTDTAPGIERVREPEHGRHDTMWHIAQRCLGDGKRWPEIWALNVGSTQPDGRVLRTPDLIHPGDHLRIPDNPTRASRPASQPPPPGHNDAPPAPPEQRPAGPPGVPPPSPAPAPQNPAAPTPRHDSDTPSRASTGDESSWDLGVFVSVGLASAVSALVVLARRRRHARYRPGSRRRDDDPPLAPAVYQLRLAHLRAPHHDNDLPLEAREATPPRSAASYEPAPGARATPPPREVDTAPATTPVPAPLPTTRRVVGQPATAKAQDLPSMVDIAVEPTCHGAGGAAHAEETGHTQVALDLAGVDGLGLLGPGGYAAARALLLTVLATAQDPVTVLVPVDDLARLLGVPVHRAHLPETVTVVDDLPAALMTLEAEWSHRRTVLVTSVPSEPGLADRLRHLLSDSAPGLTALILGQWRPGITAYVTPDGLISATDPGPGEALRGCRAFTLPETATRDLLDFLRTARTPDPVSDTPDDESALRACTPTPAPPPATEDAPTDASAADPGAPPNPVSHGLEITTGPPDAAPPEPKHEPEQQPPHADEPTEAAPRPRPLVLTVFGAPRLHWRPDPHQPEQLRDVSGVLTSRPAELLAFLSTRPAGASREAITDALWPGQPPRNPGSALRTVLSRLRRALQAATHGAVADLVVAHQGQYQLDSAVEVDYHAFAAALARRRTAATQPARVAADEDIVARYGGILADGLDAEWLTAAREATRRDALDAVAALARTTVDTDPEYTLDLLETARTIDPCNELLYRDIMRVQHVLGHHCAISRTLTLLHTHLAEIDTTPTSETAELAQRLRARADTTNSPRDE